MARPREFDEGEALDAMMSTFWSRGFEATSIQDLVEASGVARASLYGAFGDKEAIFNRVLQHYVERAERAREAALAESSATTAIEKLFESSLSGACPRGGPRGCLLLIATANDQPWARKLSLEQMKKSESALAEIIRRGQDAGEFARALDPDAMARMIVVLLQGLAATARAGWSRERLSEVLADTLDQLRAKKSKR